MDQQKSVQEVVDLEKQMLSLIHSKAILDNEVLGLYRKIRTAHENALLDANQMVRHREIEYHLWRLHYQLVDEFRKKIRKQSHNPENAKTDHSLESINSESKNNKGQTGLLLFLTEANEFYRSLILKLRKSCGLVEEIFQSYEDRVAISVEPQKVNACQYTCHRLLICLGDLARYAEFVKKSEACEWSTAGKFYSEAARTWPDSGNPHNQLALLATYVGDSFLALYHCVRSLALEEPFPDAWRNIMLLFEENRSTELPSLSTQMQLDFSNPSKKIDPQKAYHAHEENNYSQKLELWPLLVRTISFFVIRSSLDEFSYTLASALSSLEAFLAVKDSELSVSLESYQKLDPSGKGLHRAIQLVVIFIFIVHSLTQNPETEGSKSRGNDEENYSELKPLAFAAMFIFMGRLTERCIQKDNLNNICPLLPAVHVFLQWFLGSLGSVETCSKDERVANAFSYFLDTLAGLLDRVDSSGDEPDQDGAALWEDHELRGFYPLARVHGSLDFETRHEWMENEAVRNRCLLRRVFRAGKRVYENFRFSKSSESTEKSPGRSFGEPDPSPEARPAAEDEEVILFKPITRRNSAPIYFPEPNTAPIGPSGSRAQPGPADEVLRRAMSLSAGENTETPDSFSFHSTPINRQNERNNTGPPSLSAWNIERESGPHGFSRLRLSPIEEIVSTSRAELSAQENVGPKLPKGVDSAIIHEPPPRATPVPSAPLLPDNAAAWMRANPSFTPHERGNEADGILHAGPAGWPVARFVDGPTPFQGMSSSEWLYHYRNNQNMGGGGGYLLSPVHYNASPFLNFGPRGLSGFELYDQWGNQFASGPMMYLGGPGPQVLYGGEGQKRERYLVGSQRSFPYYVRDGVGMEMGPHQPTLLQYLKERGEAVAARPEERHDFYGKLSL